MKITEAQPEGLEELATFARATYAEAFGLELGASVLAQHLALNMSNAQFAQMLQVDSFYLARVDTALVGFAQVGVVDVAYEEYVNDFEPSGFELRRLYVEKNLRSQGVGSQLLQHAMQTPGVQVAKCVYLTTWEANRGAQKFYRRHKFNKIGQMREYNANGKLTGYEHIMVYMN